MGYPPALYDAIHARLGGDAGAVLEIGPGTGLATRDIMARLHPSRLVAVEADARLAGHLEARLADPRVAGVADGFVEASLDRTSGGEGKEGNVGLDRVGGRKHKKKKK